MDPLEVILRNIWTLLILLLFGIASLYFLLGSSLEIPVEKWIRQEQEGGAGYELNARGVQELAAGQDERAVATLKEAVALEPRNPIIIRNLSIALARAAMVEGHSDDSALNLLQESLELWPQNPEGLDGMATVHFRNSRYDEALEYATRLQVLLPDRPDLDTYVAHLRQRVDSVKGMVSEEGDRFRLLYSGERRLEFEGEVIALLQAQMDALTAALGVFPEDTVDVLILTEDLGDRADRMDPFMEGLYDGQIRLYMGDGIQDREKLVLTVRHEMVHALLHDAAGILPGWVQEGLAQKVGEDPPEEKLQAARGYVVEALKQGYDLNLGSLDNTFIGLETEERSRAYATSLLFIDWLVKNYGDNFIPKFVSEISSGTNSYAAVKNVTGIGFDRVQETFKRDLTGDI